MRYLLVLFLACAPKHTKAPPAVAQSPQRSGVQSREMQKLTEAIVRDLEREAPAGIKRALAITDFVDTNGQASPLGHFLADELATRLIQSGKVRVVERGLLSKVLAEQEMGASNLVDDSTAARIGKMIGADTLCTGTVTFLGTEARVNARVIKADTAEVFGATALSFSMSPELIALSSGAQQPVQMAPRKDLPVVFLKRPLGQVRPQTLTIRNQTSYCLRLTLNGDELRIFERAREVGCIPPNERSFIELSSLGQVTIAATASAPVEPFTPVASYEQTHFFREQKKGSVLLLSNADFAPYAR